MFLNNVVTVKKSEDLIRLFFFAESHWVEGEKNVQKISWEQNDVSCGLVLRKTKLQRAGKTVSFENASG